MRILNQHVGMLILLTLFAYYLQTLTFLNGDVGSLLYDTKLFLAGGHYIRDFFETNPPMIFILYSPVSLLNTKLSFPPILTMRIYIITVAWCSLGLSCYLLNKIIKSEDRSLYWLLIYTLLFIFLFLPTLEFGQREHFFLMLFMPYVLAVIVFAQNQKLPLSLAILIGVMAGLSVGMKPYFLAPLVLLETYLIYLKKNLFGWVRPAALVCAAVLCVYLVSVIYFYPNYFTVLMPLISHLYYVGIQQAWTLIFSQMSVVFSFFMLTLAFIFRKYLGYPELVQVFLCALLGMVLTFIITRAPWYYHVYPAIGFAILFVTLFFYQVLFVTFKNAKLRYRECVLLFLIAYSVPFYIFALGTRYGLYIKKYSCLNDVITYMHSLHKKTSIYCFSPNTTGDCFTLIYLTDSTYAGRYPFFWWLKGLETIETKTHKHLPIEIARDKKYFIDNVAQDLNQYRPELLIIKNDANTILDDETFDFRRYFLTNQAFALAWQHYRYSKTIGIYDLYDRIY